MRNKRVQDIVTKLLIYFMVIIMLINGFRMFVGKVLIEKYNISNEIVETIFADDDYYSEYLYNLKNNQEWYAIYPFETSESNRKESNSMAFNYFWNEGFIASDSLVYLSNLIEEKLGWDVQLNVVTKENNQSGGNNKLSGEIYDAGDGFLVECISKTDEEYVASRVNEFYNYLSSNDIAYLYVQCPGKLKEDEETDFFMGAIDYSNDNCDRLLALFEKCKIPYLDLRECAINEEELDYRALFYKTDHHWNNYGALWAAGKVNKWISERFKTEYSDEMFNISNYNITQYSKAFLGTYGRQKALKDGQRENYDLLLPDFKTDLQSYVPNDKTVITGDFEKIFNFIESKDSISYDDFGKNGAFTEITNRNAQNELKVIILSDSFGCSFLPFFSLGVKKSVLINNREFTGSIEAVIRQYEPDIVIQLNAVSSILGPDVDSVNNSLWDFR